MLGKRGITALAFRGKSLHIGLAPRGHWKIEDGHAIKLSRQPVGCFGPSNKLVVRAPGTACGSSVQTGLHVTAMAIHNNQIMVATFDQGLRVRKKHGFERIGHSPRFINALLSVKNDLFLGTAEGLYRLRGGHISLPHDWVTALWPVGNDVYAGTYKAGVAKLTASGGSTRLSALEQPWITPAGISVVDGALAVATLGDGLWFYRGGSAKRAPRLPSDDVTAIIRHHHTLWIGTRAGVATLHGFH